MIRPATTRVILGFDSSNSLQEVSFVKSTAVTDTDVSIERVNLALYDSYVVTGPCLQSYREARGLTSGPPLRHTCGAHGGNCSGGGAYGKHPCRA